MGDENPIRTLGDYSKPRHKGYRNTIELPVGNNVVPLRSDTIRLVQNECSFYGLRSEDPNQHLKDFLKLVDSLALDGDNKERMRLCLFQFSLRDQASNWLERRTGKLCNDILMFQQHHGESLSEAWTRFKDLLQKVPHHGIDLWLQLAKKMAKYESNSEGQQLYKNDYLATLFGKYNYEEGLIDHIYELKTSRFSVQASSSMSSGSKNEIFLTDMEGSYGVYCQMSGSKMTTFAEHIIVARAENRHLMLEKSMYDSWQGDGPIHYINKAMAFLSFMESRFLPSNNLLKTSSNPKNQATIQDGRVTVQQVQGRQTQSFAGTGNKGITTTLKGNYAAG
nr:zinc finger, CCHC-type [Tanacetum cinerariifolium]